MSPTDHPSFPLVSGGAAPPGAAPATGVLGGRLEPGRLPSLLGELVTGGGSGRLCITSEGKTCEIYFALGRIAGARDERGSRGFEEAAIEAGASSEAVLRARRRSHATGRRLGVELVAAMALGAPALRGAIAAHTARVLSQALELRGAAWQLDTGLECIPPEVETDLDASCPDVVSAATARLESSVLIAYQLGHADGRVALAAPPGARYEVSGLSPLEGFVLSRVSGSRPLSELLSQLGPEPRTRRALLALVCLGLVRVTPELEREPESHEIVRTEVRRILASRTLDHFQVLGVERSASEAELRGAWAALARLLHPDHTRGASLDALRPQLTAAFQRAAEAYKTLSDPLARRAYVERLAGPVRAGRQAGPAPDLGDVTLPPRTVPAAPLTKSRAANEPASEPVPATAVPREEPRPLVTPAMLEERFFEARRHHEARRYWEALQIAEDLLRQAQGRLLRERLYLLRARCQAENPHWLHEAAASLREALEEFPQSAEIHVELAALYKRAGLQQRASHELRAALRCDPQHTRAGAELKALSENPSGVFRGLRERLAVARAPAAR